MLICPSERLVELIKEKRIYTHAIRYISGNAREDIDWSCIRGFTPIIIPENSINGFRNAMYLYKKLLEYNFTPSFLSRNNEDNKIAWDIETCIKDNENFIGFRTYSNMIEYAKNKFGHDISIKDIIYPVLVSEVESRNCDEVLINNFLTINNIVFLIGYRGSGKSLLSMYLSILFKNGKSGLGGLICPNKKYEVFYLDAEMQEDVIAKRFKQLCNGLNIQLDNNAAFKIIPAVGKSELFNLEKPDNFNRLKPFFLSSDIIIIDGVFRFFPSSMNSNIDGTHALQNVIEYFRSNGKTVIFIDHVGKSKADAFGSMGKELLVDAIAKLKPQKGTISFEVTKSRHFAEPGILAKFKLISAKDGSSLIFNRLDGDERDAYVPAINKLEINKQKIVERYKMVEEYYKKYPRLSQEDLWNKIHEEHPDLGRTTITNIIRKIRESFTK